MIHSHTAGFVLLNVCNEMCVEFGICERSHTQAAPFLNSVQLKVAHTHCPIHNLSTPISLKHLVACIHAQHIDVEIYEIFDSTAWNLFFKVLWWAKKRYPAACNYLILVTFFFIFKPTKFRNQLILQQTPHINWGGTEWHTKCIITDNLREATADFAKLQAHAAPVAAAASSAAEPE